MTYARAVTAQLLDYDADTVISGALDQAFGISGMIELSGYGFGECSLPFDDANILQLRRGRYVRILIGGTARFHFKIGGAPRYQQVSEDGKINQFVTVSGQGWGCILEEVIVHPEHPDLTLPLDYSYRWFTFASINFPNAGSWGNATEQYEYLDFDEAATRNRVVGVENTGVDPDDPADDELELFVAPIGFPWPYAPKNGNGSAPTPVYAPVYWITADGAPSEDAIGTHFFREAVLTLADDQQMTIFVTADNLFTFFVNGVPILGEDADISMWSWWKETTFTLPAGDHYFAAAAENVDVPSITNNPGGFLCAIVALAVYPGDIDTSLTLLLSGSDASWASTFSSGDWPGWRSGQIILQLLEEAIDRGALTQFDAVGSTTFTGSVDSDGNPYTSADPDDPIEFIPSFSCRIGQTYGDVLRQLHDQGWGDWMMSGDALDLNFWAPGSLGGSSGVDFHLPTDPDDPSSGNLVNLERGETKPYDNYLLVQWAGGLTVVSDSAEIVALGTQDEDVFVTDATTEEEAQRLGRVELEQRKLDERSSIMLTIEPTSAADCPFEGFDIGETVTIPQVDGSGTDTEMVHAIYFDADDAGWVKWKLEVGQRWRAAAIEREETLRNLGGKTLGSPSPHGIIRD